MDTSIKELEKEIGGIRSGSSVKSAPNAQEERMLLSKSSGRLFADYLETEVAVEVERAVWQVEKALKAQQERREKAELDAVTKNKKKPEQGR